MVYVELLVVQDLIYNYIILLGVSILLTRITNFKKIFLSSVIGTIPLIFLSLDINNGLKFLICFIFSIIMSLITFHYKDIVYTIKNIVYMYLISIFIAGGINLININILPNIDSYLLNVFLLILIAPILSFIYIRSITNTKNTYSNYYKVDIYIDEKEKISLTAFLDTGNKLIDPYKHRPIILVNKSLINLTKEKILLVPYNTLNSNEILKCIVPKKIFIKEIGSKNNFLIGLMDEVNIEGVDCILNSKLLERV